MSSCDWNPKKHKLCKRGYCTAKRKFKVYPSAYANAYAVQVCKGTKPDWRGVKKRDYSKSTRGRKSRRGQKSRQKSKSSRRQKSRRSQKSRRRQKSKRRQKSRQKSKRRSSSSLDRWFKEKWVNVCSKTKSGKYRSCGRRKANTSSASYPYCRPSRRISSKTPKTVGEMSKSDIRRMCKKKRSRKQGVKGKPAYTRGASVSWTLTDLE